MWKVISWSKLLEKHINSVHNGQKDHKCVTCGKQFSQAGTLKKHINSVYKVGHLLSELAIEFASELWCQILLSKVTNKLSESWCQMHVECGSIWVPTVDNQPYWFFRSARVSNILTLVFAKISKYLYFSDFKPLYNDWIFKRCFSL